MISKLVELLGQNISDKTGIRTVVAPDLTETLERLAENKDEQATIYLASTATPFLEPKTYEAHYADGVIKHAYYDLDHIPTEVSIILCVIAPTAQEVEDIAFTIRDTYMKNADAGMLMFPINEDGTCAAVHFSAKQLRTPVEEFESCATTLIEQADGLKVPMTYPYADLRASLSDRSAVTRLLITYFFYLTILESNIPNRLTSEYARLFVQKNSGDNGKERGKGFLGKGKSKLADSKRSLFSKLRENELAASVLDSGFAQSFTGEGIGNFVRDFQTGTLSKEDFEAYFNDILFVLPDLYDRAVKHEPVEVTLAEAQAVLTEIDNRAEAIANSLGIEENPEGDEYYKPRSLEAAAAYINVYNGDLNLSAQDLFRAYKAACAEKAAGAQQLQDSFNNYIADKISSAAGGGFVANIIADQFRK